MFHLISVRVLLAALAAISLLVSSASADVWKAGAAKLDITPKQRIWMSGYGSRKKPAEGKLTDGADFAKLAMKRSEDSSAVRGGELGSLGRGRLAIPFEAALFPMKTGELSTVVETEFGYHIIQRLP